MRRRFLTPIVVLAALFGLGAAASAAGRMVGGDPGTTADPAHDPALHLVYSYDGDEQWHGPRVTLPSKKYQAIATYACEDSGFLYLSWHGEPYSYETAHSSQSSGTVTLNGEAGKHSGYFSIETWMGCSWSLKVYAS